MANGLGRKVSTLGVRHRLLTLYAVGTSQPGQARAFNTAVRSKVLHSLGDGGDHRHIRNGHCSLAGSCTARKTQLTNGFESHPAREGVIP